MEFTDEDLIKKALLDTQEKVRDFQNYSQIIQDPLISGIFKEYAEQEAMQARRFNHILNKSGRIELGEHQHKEHQDKEHQHKEHQHKK